MPIQMKTPIKKEFHLEKSDKEFDVQDGATMITIRQATQGDFEMVICQAHAFPLPNPPLRATRVAPCRRTLKDRADSHDAAIRSHQNERRR